MSASALKCPACSKAKAPRMYLCRGCWFTLQPTARRALNQRGPVAVARLAELLKQIRAGVALHEIGITT